MSNIKLREAVLVMRKKGASYSQIKNALGIAKSTLSNWLKDFPLSCERINQLRANNEGRIEKFRQTMCQKKEDRLRQVYEQEKKVISVFSNQQLFAAGLALYLGEGSKAEWFRVTVTNTDPKVLVFFKNWLLTFYNVKREKMRVALQLYKDMNIDEEKWYWSKELDIPVTQFIKPYVKVNISGRINHKGSFGHGTCAISVYDVALKEKIMMQLKILTEQINKRL